MIKKILVLVFLGVALVSCGGSKSTDGVSKSAEKDNVTKLNGDWELEYITGPRIAFDKLYANKKPTINFNTKENHVSGNNGCNTFTGKLNVEGSKIDFTQPLAVTKKMCLDRQGEQVFMSTLQKINKYAISEDGKKLTFISGDIAMMRFIKK